MAVHRAVLQTEALTAAKMEDRMAEVLRVALQTEDSKVVKMAEVHRAVPQVEASKAAKMVEVHRAVPQAEDSKAVAKMAEVHRAVPQTERLTVAQTVCKECPVIWVDSPVEMAITSPTILPVIMVWECPQ